MLYQPRAICLHANSDDKNSTSRIIGPQTVGHRVKPFISLEVVRAGERSSSDEFLMSSDSGTAIIMFMLSGEADFSDSTNKHGCLKKNDVLWILAGSGIRYSLKPKTQDCISIKLRIALSPALKCAPAQSSYLASNLVERDGSAHVLLGHYGHAQSGFALPALINYLVVTLSAGQEWIYEPPVNHRVAWVAALSGKIKTSNRLISSDEIAVYENSHKSINFLAKEDSVFLLGSSQEYMHDFAVEQFPATTLGDTFDRTPFNTSVPLMCT